MVYDKKKPKGLEKMLHDILMREQAKIFNKDIKLWKRSPYLTKQNKFI